MEKQAILITLLLTLILISGCQTGTTGKTTINICDDKCQQERDAYINSINDLLTQAQGVTSKIDEWKTITKEEFELIKSLRDQVLTVKTPEGFEMAQEYYTRAFNHYVEAIDYVIKAKGQYDSTAEPSSVQARNIAMTIIINNIQEANKLLIYADEEAKFATRLISKS